jgi:hypothetical protein
MLSTDDDTAEAAEAVRRFKHLRRLSSGTVHAARLSATRKTSLLFIAPLSIVAED